MRIDTLNIRNFKGFKELECSFHPEFNLIVGENGTGKTALLDALSVAIGGWLLGLRGCQPRDIHLHEVRLESLEQEIVDDDGEQRTAFNWESQYPCEIEATGEVLGQPVSWSRALKTPVGLTTYTEARQLHELSGLSDKKVKSGETVLLPLISYYGTGRVRDDQGDKAQVKGSEDFRGKEGLSRLEAYRDCLDGRVSVPGLMQWIRDQAWITFDEGGHPPAGYLPVRDAMVRCIEGAKDIRYYRKVRQVIVELENQLRHPFTNLSDGQRCMLAMVGDIAMKAATLNPHLGPKVLEETPGVVLIDELDLHLHPRWQRHVIEDLRRTFPKIQFFAATHSPFLIQSLRSGEELMMLDGHPPAQVANKPLQEIARQIMKIAKPEVSARYEEMQEAARHYLETLEEAEQTPEEKLAAFKEKLEESIALYSDNPAFQAFLEMKRAAKLGE
ncbi:MAG: AAA family ATPase [Thermodesulfobacteriota bacterium]